MGKKKNKDSVATPKYILDALTKEFGDLFDPCPLNDEWDESKDENGLKIPWGQTSFCNPPYSNVKPWIEKAVAEHSLGKTVVLLLKTDIIATAYFGRFAKHVSLRFFNHRIRFPSFEHVARFSSVLVVLERDSPKCTFQIVDYRN